MADSPSPTSFELRQSAGRLGHKKLQPMAVIGYFLTPSSGLDDLRPRDLLRDGKLAQVLNDAERYGDIGV
jgi:hypothetical protein